MSKSFRIYRPNKQNTGSASEFSLSYDKERQYDEYLAFLYTTAQTGVDTNGNATFDWKASIKVKLGSNDLGELIACLEGRTNECKLFHESDAGSKTVNLVPGQTGGYFLRIGHKNKEGKVVNLQHSISNGEASILLVLLKRSVEKLYSW